MIVVAEWRLGYTAAIMSIGEQIELHMQRARDARQLLARLQGEAKIHAERLSRLANRLNRAARESAEGLSKLNELNLIFDGDMNELLASHLAGEQLEAVLREMVVAAGTLTYEREELRKLGVQLAE